MTEYHAIHLCYTCKRSRPNSSNDCETSKHIHHEEMEWNLKTAILKCNDYQKAQLEIPEDKREIGTL